MASDKQEKEKAGDGTSSTSQLSMGAKTEIATSISSSKEADGMRYVARKKKKALVTQTHSSEEEKKSADNTRGIPQAVYVTNPYDIVYKGRQERYLREVEEVLG